MKCGGGEELSHILPPFLQSCDIILLAPTFALESWCAVDNLIRKKTQDPIGLQGQGVIVNYIPKFEVVTLSLEVA